MLPASNRGPGQALGFPDTCLTPATPAPVPLPNPNVAMNAQAFPFSPTVKVNMMNALNLTSSIPMTMGDEAGSAHPLFKQAQRYTLGSFNVFVDGMPGIHLGSMTTHNNMNCPIGAVIVPSAPNVTYSRAPEQAADPRASRFVGLAEIHELAREAVASVEQAALAITVRLQTSDEVSAGVIYAAAQRAPDVRKITIDLRGCPGGCLEGAAAICSLFLPAGTVVCELVEEDGDVRPIRTLGGGELVGFEVTVLQDERTASAAEVVGGALAAHGAARLSGERSYGKGVAHELAVGEAGDAVLLRRGEVRLHTGARIDGVGVGGS